MKLSINRLVAVTIVAIPFVSLSSSADAATAAGAGIEVDGKYIGGYTITRNGETREDLVRHLPNRPLTFERDFTIPVDAKDPNRATLKGRIRLLSKIRGDRQVMATPETLQLVRRNGRWFVEKGSLERALKAAGESPGKKAKAEKTGGTALLIDMDAVRHKLPAADAKFLTGLASKPPDDDTPDRIKLDPKYRVILDGVDYALQPDSLILAHRDGTRIWNSPGIRKRIVRGVGIE